MVIIIIKINSSLSFSSFFCSYLVTTCGDVTSQSLHFTVKDIVFLHLVLHRWQVLTKALVVQVVLGQGRQNISVHSITCLHLTCSGYY